MMGDWTFFSNYGHVMVSLARNREVRLRDVAAEVGITERAVQKIVRDLQDAGYLTVTKQGRCNRYRINRRKTLRHSLESHCTVGKMLALTAKPPRDRLKSTAEANEKTGIEAEAVPEQLEPDVAEALSPKQTPAPAPAKPPVKKPAKAKDPEKSSRPLDHRQQGSLF